MSQFQLDCLSKFLLLVKKLSQVGMFSRKVSVICMYYHTGIASTRHDTIPWSATTIIQFLGYKLKTEQNFIFGKFWKEIKIKCFNVKLSCWPDFLLQNVLRSHILFAHCSLFYFPFFSEFNLSNNIHCIYCIYMTNTINVRSTILFVFPSPWELRSGCCRGRGRCGGETVEKWTVDSKHSSQHRNCYNMSQSSVMLLHCSLCAF